ncbi:MAG: hypothetical protein E7302_09985 [Butyrivibrio sp.]|nr:hypothetical protein [Butyrivibrio sp.]
MLNPKAANAVDKRLITNHYIP